VVARGSFQYDASTNDRSDEDEKVTLVGHSTGELDIRRLLHDLRQLKESKQVILVDGEVKVEPEVLLRLISLGPAIRYQRRRLGDFSSHQAQVPRMAGGI
jgi:hypothetical protein